MAEIVTMPRLSDTMTEGVVAKWHKQVGDKVSEGDLLAEIETDKATMDFESFQEGVLLHIGVEEGGSAAVDTILAILGDEGEDVSKILAEASAGTDAPKEEKPAEAEKAPEPKSEVKPAAPKAAKKTAAAKPVSNTSGRVIASPLAKKLAEEKGIQLDSVSGSGDGGRIIKRDIDNYSAPANTGATMMAQESYTDKPVSQMRKTIGRRLSESKFSAPHFYLTIALDMDKAIEARKAINAMPDTKVSFNDLVVKAAALSLKKHPEVNSAWMDDFIRQNDHVNIGIAVAVDEGLLVPVVRFADGKSLTQISGEVREYAQKAKSKKLQPSDWEGNTFTISNLGMFGIEEFTAIINSPDACIMAVGAIQQIPVVKDGAVVPGNVMKVTLSCDHRVVDGALGAAFLQTFKTFMENPVTMLG